MEKLYKKTVEYIETRAELIKLKVVDKGSRGVSKLVSVLVLMALLCMIFVLTSVALAIWAGELMGHIYLGFFAIAGFYLLLFIILLFSRQSLIEGPVRARFTKSFLN